MTQMIGPVNAWPASVESIKWSEDQPFLIIDLLSTNSGETIERHLLIPMSPDHAWQLALLLQEALERKGIPRPKEFPTAATEQ
jgi:hypothetical protein